MIKKILDDIVKKYSMNINIRNYISYLITILGIYFIGFIIGYLIGLITLVFQYLPSAIKSFWIVWAICGILIYVIDKNN